MTSRMISYRPDIDGLRAVAVLLVVLNHVGFSTFAGGFIGVDVFLVISGFLITGIIQKQGLEGRFSFIAFYVRRAKRLLPALYVLLLCVLAVGYRVLLPSDYSALAGSALSSILFAANIFFWQNSDGYFSSSAEEMPLLHIWSLSLEEQFYFVWPVALLVLLKLKARHLQLAGIAIVIVLSFGVAEMGVNNEWSGTYFLLPSRAGELLLGAMLAIALRGRVTSTATNRAAANLVSLAGILMVLLPALYLDGDSSFPGLNALVPCLGAALVIAAPYLGSNLVSRLLSFRPLVFIGLTSYSVYLWHWPLISYLRYARVDITWPIASSVIALSLFLGYLSWRFVEQTFRQDGALLSGGVRGLALAIGIAVTASPVIIHMQDGLPSRFPFALLTQEQLNAERGRYWQGIETKSSVFENNGAVKNILVVGNSHAYDLSYALTENEYPGVIKLIETSHRCFNFGHDALEPDQAEFCNDRFEEVLNSPELGTADTVFLHDNWGSIDPVGLEATLDQIRARTDAPIIVVGPKMIFSDVVLNISRFAQQERLVTAAEINDFSRRYYVELLFQYDQDLRAFFAAKRLSGVTYVSALDVQCGPERECDILSAEGEYLYFDSNHFTLAGARRFGEKLKQGHRELF